MRHLQRACLGALLTGILVAGAMPARAETMKECSVRFQAAKQAGTLNGADWKTFRATQCSNRTASAAPAPASPASASPASALPVAVADAPVPGKAFRIVRRRAGRHRERHLSRQDRREIRQPDPRPGAHEDLRRPVQAQQGQWRQRRHEVAAEGRRLLQRLRQAPQGRLTYSAATCWRRRRRVSRRQDRASPAFCCASHDPEASASGARPSPVSTTSWRKSAVRNIMSHHGNTPP